VKFASASPDLVEEFLTSRQARVNRSGLDTSDPKVPRLDISFETEQGASGKIEIFSGGSGTGFEKLRTNMAPIWMSSRPANEAEIKQYSDLKLGSLHDPDSEHVIALDGLAVVVHPNNPVGVLSLDQIARIFSGDIKDWSEVDGPSGKIKVFRRSDESGTNSTFKDLIMAPAKLQFGSEVRSIVKNEDLQAEVQRDEAAIGFIGIGFVSSGLKALAIRTKCGMAYKPDKFSIKTEEYPLSRRLFLYTSAKIDNDIADQLLKFTLSDEGQQIVTKSGFVELGLGTPEKFESQAGRIANMLAVGASDLSSTKKFLDAVRFAERLPVAIRFKSNSAEIDNKGERDLGLSPTR
jgi:phosphate transport system substrate-binding protein